MPGVWALCSRLAPPFSFGPLLTAKWRCPGMIRAYSNLLRVALFGSALLPAVSLYALPFAGRGVLDIILYLVLALLLSLALHRLLVRLQPFLAKRAAEQRAWLDSTP